MVVRRSKGITWTIRVVSIIGIPIITMMVFASVSFIIEYKNSKELIFFILFFFLVVILLIFTTTLTIQAYRRNPNILKTENKILLTDSGFKVYSLAIEDIERLDYRSHSFFTFIIFKSKNTKTKRIAHFCNLKDLEKFRDHLKKNKNIKFN